MKSLLILVPVLLLVVVASVFFLDRLSWKVPARAPVSPPQTAEKHRLPPREQPHTAVHEEYTGSISEPKEEKPRRPRVSGSGMLAIVVDDMGKGVQEVRSLLDIGVSLTFAIIPGLPKVRQVAEEARKRGQEVMIHLPMEPKGYPEQRLEDNGLLLRYSNEEVAERVNGYLKEIPQAVGANNHMGSSFTENREKMAVVLGILKERGLFFVDSKTSPVSVGSDVAREMGVRTAARNVFLDNIQDVGYISKQLTQAANMARKRGSAIAICHPHPATIQALASQLPRLKEEGITFVPVSRLVQ